MTTDTTAGAFNPPAASDGRATADHALYRKLRQKLSRVHPANQAPDCPLQIRLTYGEISRLSTALLYSAPPASGADLTDRFWLIVREPGRVPDRKGPWKHSETAKVLREFMAANPTAFIDHLTIGDDGTPDVEHGPLVLQYTDGRSMAVGRKHNERTRAAAKAALAAPDDITCAGAEDAVTAIAKAVCWHHFGLKWEHAEKASHEDLRGMVTRMLHAGVSPARPEPVDKKTMTISLSEREQEALERLMAEQALSAPQIFKCALREYQMGHERRKAGETVVWSGDEQRARDFAGPLARPEPVVDGAAEVGEVCEDGGHCCCCGPGDPCCDCGQIMPDREELPALRRALADLLHACRVADAKEDLSPDVDGELMDAAEDALELQYPIIWTADQVELLKRRQDEPMSHPYTCGNRSNDERSRLQHEAQAAEDGDHEPGLLIPTRRGWICPACDYRQFWAHEVPRAFPAHVSPPDTAEPPANCSTDSAVRAKAIEECARVADERAAGRQQLFEENGSSINASKSVEAEEIAAAIRALLPTEAR